MHNLTHTIIWPSINLMYGLAINSAIEITAYPYFVYVCSNHGHMYDPTWLDDLVNPIVHDSRVAMPGSLYPIGNPTEMGFPSYLPHVHIQGGVFGARTEALIAYSYTRRTLDSLGLRYLSMLSIVILRLRPL